MEWQSSDDWRETTLPHKMTMYFSPDETPLFRVRNAQNRTPGIFFIIPIIVSLLVVLIIFATVISFSFILVIMIFIPVLLIGFMFLVFHSVLKSQQLLLLTNKRIYLYTKRQKFENIDTLNFSDLKAIIYRKRRFLERKDNTGTIDFIGQEYKTALITINDVQEIRQCQRIIESILYEYGGFKERWDEIKEKSQYNFPYNFKISADGLNILLKRNSRLNLYLMIIYTATLLSIILFYIFVPSIISFLTLIMVIFIFFVGVLISVPVLSEKYLLKRRPSPSNAILRLDSERISISDNPYPASIPLNPETSLNYLKLTHMMGKASYKREEYKYMLLDWYEDNLALQIKPSYDSNLAITFGPVNNFPDIYDLLFCYFINWKGERNHLLSKEQIFQLEKQEIDAFSVEIKKQFATGTSAILVPEEILEPIEENLYQSFYHLIEPDEKILLSYKPLMNLTGRLLFCSLSIIGIIFGISCTYIFPMWIFSQLFIAIIILMWSIFALVFNSIEFLGENTLKNAVFIFTNKKIVIKFPKSYTIVYYSDIATVLRKDKKKFYNIELNLKHPIKTIPFSVRILMTLKYNIIQKPTILIPEVPQGDKLIEKINYIREDSFL
ncbi:MAG TPA: hypothetical protein VMV49_03880 [Candidatus Deferrimicrobium sp.]|nr:hypothetical protein [Candidatus Deferrimicrobium sp.]